MLRKLGRGIGILLAIVILLLMTFVLIGIFLSPIYLMFTVHWAAGFLFFISWIPTVFVATIFTGIITAFFD